jgi:hypothetical protein
MNSNTCIEIAPIANVNPNPNPSTTATVTSNNDWCEDDFFAMN